MLPELVEECLRTWFGYPEKQIFCQVSTSWKDHPHIRTMLLGDITQEGNMVFFSRIDTQKWRDLQHSAYMAVCMLNMEYGQMIIEGESFLKTIKNHYNDVQLYWDQLPQTYKNIYQPLNTEGQAPDSFGVIYMMPSICEVLRINKEDYLKSKREQFQLLNGSWTIQNLNVS